MTNLLNLDELAPAKRTVTLGGTSHEVKPMTVEAFVRRQREAKDVDDTTDPAEQIERAVKMISETIPTIKIEVLNGLTMEQLTALINFVVSTPDDVKPTEEAETAEAGK